MSLYVFQCECVCLCLNVSDIKMWLCDNGQVEICEFSHGCDSLTISMTVLWNSRLFKDVEALFIHFV